MKSKEGFEGMTCSRCCGSGKYSFNTVNGDTCFGCGGTGFKLTKRGAVARAFYEKSLLTPAGELKVGDWVKVDRAFEEILAVEIGPAKTLGTWHVGREDEISMKVTTTKCTWYCGKPDTLVRKRYTGEQKAPLLAAALAFEATLTKLGKPSARRTS